MANLILPLRRIGRGPHHHQGLDNRTKRCVLRHKKHAGARLAFLQASPKMLQHRPPVMRDQNAALAGCNLKDIGVRNPFEFTIRSRSEVDCRFSPPNCHNDSVMDVGVSLVADQGRDSPILARARWSLSHSPGFSSDSGMLLTSNSRALSSTYLSISVLWSR